MYFYEFCSCRSLKLMHPLMPFVSEELWNRLPHLAGEAPSLMIASYAFAPCSFPPYFVADGAVAADTPPPTLSGQMQTLRL
jgi:hypothetical protein